MGLTYDNISGTHTLTFGSPIPTNNVSAGVSFKNTNTYLFDLKDFPAGILPSGGSSNIASASEVVMCQLREENYSPRNDKTIFEWHKAAGIHNADKILYTGTGPEFAEDPNWTFFYSFDFSIIGHFSWEINEPGYYYVIIKADGGRGNARIDFQVVDTSPASQTITHSNLGFADIFGIRYQNCSVLSSNIGKNIKVVFDYSVSSGPISGIIGQITFTKPNGQLTSYTFYYATTSLTGSVVLHLLNIQYEAGNYSNLRLTKLETN